MKMIAAVKIINEMEFLRKEKFVGSAFSFLEYLTIKMEMIFLRMKDNTKAPIMTPAITMPRSNVNHSLINAP
jgi:hypothetical protein